MNLDWIHTTVYGSSVACQSYRSIEEGIRSFEILVEDAKRSVSTVRRITLQINKATGGIYTIREWNREEVETTT